MTGSDVEPAGIPGRLLHQVELELQNRELREAQVLHVSLYDFAPVGYCTLDPNGLIQELNAATAALLGAPAARLVGSSFQAVAALESRQAFRTHLLRCAKETGQVVSELVLRSARGARSVRIISERVRDALGELAYRSALVDVSDLKEMETRLRLLATAGETLASSLERPAVIDAAVGIAVPALADLCMIDLVSESGRIEREAVRFADPTSQATLAGPLRRSTPRPGWQTPQARVIASGQPMLLPEVPDAPPEPGADAAPLLLRSLMVVPLAARGRTTGALTLGIAASGRRYTPLDLQVAMDLARRISMALDHARLYDEAQRANEALRLSEARSSGILSISADAIICVDADQRITLFNQGAERIFGYSRAEVLGAPLDLLIPPRFRAEHRRQVDRFTAGEVVARRMGERGPGVQGLRKDGEEFPADATISRLLIGGAWLLTVALRDMTVQRRIERDQRFLAEVGLALSATLDFEETLTRISELSVRHVADYCIIVLLEEDGETQRTRVLARAPDKERVCDALASIRVAPDRLLSSQALRTPVLVERVTPETLAAWAQSDDLLRALQGLEATSVVTAPLVARGAPRGIVALVASAGARAFGEGDLRLAEELARRAALALEHARLYRLAARAAQARDNVLGVVAHDLRNPLSAVLMNAALLRTGHGEPEAKLRRRCEAIERAAHRMDRLISDLLDVAGMDAGVLRSERAPIDAGQVAAEVVAAQEPLAASRSLELRLDLAPDLRPVFADRDRLAQVLENLVGNALKFTAAGGRVTVGASPGKDEVLLWVADTGVGIADAELTHVFDRFWQRKGDRAGVGLGLAIVKGIVEAHGGRVWAEGQVGVGSRFCFTVPLACPPATHPEARVPQGDGAPA